MKKKMNNSKRRRFWAVFLIWVFLQIMLLALSPHPFGEKGSRDGPRNYGSFWPFISAKDYKGTASGIFPNHVEQYDFTEFAFYSLAPLVLFFAVRLWRGNDMQEESKSVAKSGKQKGS